MTADDERAAIVFHEVPAEALMKYMESMANMRAALDKTLGIQYEMLITAAIEAGAHSEGEG